MKATPAAATPPLSPRLIDMPPLSVRAEVGPKSIDEEARTVELIVTTNAPVERFDWNTGTTYLEVLSMDPAHIRMDRLQGGVSLLDSHSAWSVSDILGATVPGSATVTKNQLRVRARFSKRDQVNPLWEDVKAGIIRHVSVGYRIFRFEEKEAKGDKPAVRTAVDWEPYEVSMVPIPADMAAMVRGARPKETNQCELVGGSAGVTTREQEKVMKNGANANGEADPVVDDTSETIVGQEPGGAAAAAATPEPNERDLGVKAERVRAQGILTACRAARLPQSFADNLIEKGVALVDAQTRVFEELQKRDVGNVPSAGARRGGAEIVGDDPLVHVRAGIENALLHRVAPSMFQLDDNGRQYRGMSMLDVARVYLQKRGIRTTNLSKVELAGLALGLTDGIGLRGGMHTTSDFALLLADVANKTLRQAYVEAPQTFAPITRRVTLSDFRVSNRLQIGDAPALLEVKEHGEFKRGSITEGKETIQLKTYGRVFAITRQALVNDDTDAFSRVATMFGRSARTLESDLVWAQITGNPVMGDGVTLFHATHGNLAGAGAVISDTTLGAARAAMRVQKGLDGVTVLNVEPKFLGVPAALETTALKQLTPITPALASSVNPFAGLLSPIVEPRLDANSVTAWYLFAGNGFDVIELATLEGGEGGPMVESRIGFDIDGLEIKARHDVAGKIIDWRGVYKNPGA